MQFKDFRPTRDEIRLGKLLPSERPGEQPAAAGFVPPAGEERADAGSNARDAAISAVAADADCRRGRRLSPRRVSSLRGHVASQTRRNMCAAGFHQLSSLPQCFSAQRRHFEPLVLSGQGHTWSREQRRSRILHVGAPQLPLYCGIRTRPGSCRSSPHPHPHILLAEATLGLARRSRLSPSHQLPTGLVRVCGVL